MRLPLRVVAALVAVALVPACGGNGPPAGDGRLFVVTTVSPITSIVAQIAGDRAEVHGIVPEGVNSHEFEPAPRMARLLARADVIFVNGLRLEDPTIRLAEANAGEAAVVRLGDRTIDEDEYVFDRSFPRDRGGPNPHLWTNPPFARRYAELVRDELIRRDPDGAPGYRERFERFERVVDALDVAVRAATASLAAERRRLLTYHDSFPYFARTYGWSVIGAIQPADFSEPSPRDVARLIEQVTAEGVPAIFGSEVFPSPVLAQIGREAGVRYVDSLRDDDLPGEPGDPAHSWQGLMQADFVTMVDALGGDAGALRRVDLGRLADHAEYSR